MKTRYEIHRIHDVKKSDLVLRVLNNSWLMAGSEKLQNFRTSAQCL